MTNREAKILFDRLAKHFAERAYPVPLKKLKLVGTHLDDAESVIPIQIGKAEPESSEELLEAELNVLGHVPDHDKPGLSSTKIMKSCGLKNQSNFMKILKRLRKKGRVVLDATGYRKQK